MLHAAILAGGSGKRFWPRSRRSLPKQFLRFGDSASLLEETWARVREVVDAAHAWVITGEDHAARCRSLLPDLDPGHVVGEPMPRDTAAAVALAGLLAEREDPDATVAVLPADHWIESRPQLAQALRSAERQLSSHPRSLLVFGIEPVEPATGYGYIEKGEALGEGAFRVAAFKEKPPRAQAEQYLAAGRFLWNAGIFCFRAATLRALVERHLPALSAGLDEVRASLSGPGGGHGLESVLRAVYPRLPQISFDHGILEHADQLLVLEAGFSWDDVGSWQALARHFPRDAGGNVCLGSALLIDSTDSIVDAGKGMVALLGVSDLIVVQSDDVTLVCRRGDSERLKELLEKMEGEPRWERFL